MKCRIALQNLAESMAPACPVSTPYVQGTSKEILEWFQPFADTILAHGNEFSRKRVVLLTVCSYAKPYSHSYIHYHIRKALYEAGLLNRIEYWHLSSAGVIPSELETFYPFCAYDWENGVATEDELSALRDALYSFFNQFLVQYLIPYKKTVITYFREESNTGVAIKLSFSRTPTPFPVRTVWVYRKCVVDEAVSLGGYYNDPDTVLASVPALKQLIRVLFNEVSDV